jgi:hypothetical protein
MFFRSLFTLLEGTHFKAPVDSENENLIKKIDFFNTLFPWTLQMLAGSDNEVT